MTLSELIKEYRKDHQLSQRQFAIKCNVSNVHISMLENNMNPRTGKPLTPTLPMLKKIADGMNITLDELLSKTEDFLVDLSPALQSDLTPDEIIVIELFRKLDAGDQGEIRGTMKQMLKADKYKQEKANVS